MYAPGLMLVLLAGCTEPPDTGLPAETGADSAGETGRDTGDTGGDTGDTGGDTGDTGDDTGDTGDTGDDTGDSPPPCGAYTNVRAPGATTEWRYYLGGGYLSVQTGWDRETGHVTAEAEEEAHTADYEQVGHVTWEHRCDAEGLWALRTYTTWTRTSGDGTTSTGWTEWVFTDTLLSVPDLAVGTAWTSAGTITITEEIDGVAQEPMTVDSSSELRVTEATAYTVEAGTFDTLKVEGLARGEPTTFYLAQGIGAVKNTGGELVAMSP